MTILNDKGNPISTDVAKTIIDQVKNDDLARNFDPKPFASLMRNEDDLRATWNALNKAILRSLALDVQRNPFSKLAVSGPTQAELRRRFRICENWIRTARGDMGMSLEQTLDLMGHALRAELDGRVFDPEMPGRMWAPT